MCDRIRTEGARTLAVYGKDFYAGEPCVTVNDFGLGHAYYVGTLPDDAFLGQMTEHICKTLGIVPVAAASGEVELTGG